MFYLDFIMPVHEIDSSRLFHTDVYKAEPTKFGDHQLRTTGIQQSHCDDKVPKAKRITSINMYRRRGTTYKEPDVGCELYEKQYFIKGQPNEFQKKQANGPFGPKVEEFLGEEQG